MNRGTLGWIVALGLVGVAGVGPFGDHATATGPDQQAEIVALQDQVADLSDRVASLEDDALPSGCIAYSDYHYYRERVDGFGRKRWRLPVMLWNMADPTCRPNPKIVWRPK